MHEFVSCQTLTDLFFVSGLCGGAGMWRSTYHYHYHYHFEDDGKSAFGESEVAVHKRSFQKGGGQKGWHQRSQGANTPLMSENKHSVDTEQVRRPVRPAPKMINALRVFFLKPQMSNGTIFEMPHRVLNVCSQYRLTFLNMIAYIHFCKSCSLRT